MLFPMRLSLLVYNVQHKLSNGSKNMTRDIVNALFSTIL